MLTGHEVSDYIASWEQKEVNASPQTLSPFPCFIQSETPAQGMNLCLFRSTLPFSVKPFWKNIPRHTQRCLSIVTVNPIKLRVEIKYHTGIATLGWYHSLSIIQSSTALKPEDKLGGQCMHAFLEARTALPFPTCDRVLLTLLKDSNSQVWLRKGSQGYQSSWDDP